MTQSSKSVPISVLFQWLFLLLAAGWVFPTTAQHFQPVWINNPYQPMNLIIDSARIDGQNFQINDEIAVFDVDASGDEYCVGVVVMVSEFEPDTLYTLTAGKDDPLTPAVLEGFIDGHEIIYRFWDDSEGEEYVVYEVSYNPNHFSVYQGWGTAIPYPMGYSALTWTGGTDNDWLNTANWNVTRTPDSATHVIIPMGLTNYPTLTSPGQCNNLTLLSDNSGDASILGDDQLNVFGDVTVQRFTTGGKWHDFAAPVGGQTAHSLYLNNNPKVWLKKYNEPSNTRTNITTLSTPLPSGSGFEVWVETGNNATFSFDGPLQTSDLILTTSSVPSLSYSGPDPLGYNLIGNPFASALDWDIGIWNLNFVNGTVWVWDGTAGNYKYRSGGQVGNLTDGVIPLAQGFFVQATDASASITIPMDARVHSAQAYYKAENTEEVANHLAVQVSLGEKNDEVSIVFDKNASVEFDPLKDARKLIAWTGDAPQLYSYRVNEFLSINCLPPVSTPGTLVELHFEAQLEDEYTLNAVSTYLEETEVLLEDKQTGVIQDIIAYPDYQFQAHPGDNPDRFLLHFKPLNLGSAEHDQEEFHVYTADNNIYVRNLNSNLHQESLITIHDIMGRLIVEKSLTPESLNKIYFPSREGIYIVTIQSPVSKYSTKLLIN